jgi:hypothetical protein
MELLHPYGKGKAVKPSSIPSKRPRIGPARVVLNFKLSQILVLARLRSIVHYSDTTRLSF